MSDNTDSDDDKSEINGKKQLKQLQQTCHFIIASFRDEEKDIMRALTNYRNLLTRYKSNEFYNKECRQYIGDHFLKDSCICLMKREHNHFKYFWNMADEICICCKLLIAIAVPLIKEDSRLAMNIIYYCLNCSSPFYSRFGHDWVKLYIILIYISRKLNFYLLFIII